jgi:colicin import membrane protein
MMMLRQRENPDSIKAGVYSVLVHTLLLGALLISFNWKTTHPISIAQVELWDSVAVEEYKPAPKPEPLPEPMPVEKEIPKPEPVVAPEEKPQPKVEIAIEKKPVKKEPVKEEQPKPVVKANDMLAKLQEEARQEALKSKSVTKSNTNDALKKMQQELLNEDKAAGEQSASAAKSAASAGLVDEFKAKIQAKIRSNVNKTLCGDGNPELKFEIGLIPTGELSGAPKLVKSSGNAACDDAVERAIRMSEPLPLPQDAGLFSQFRNLKLTFKPNEN